MIWRKEFNPHSAGSTREHAPAAVSGFKPGLAALFLAVLPAFLVLPGSGSFVTRCHAESNSEALRSFEAGDGSSGSGLYGSDWEPDPDGGEGIDGVSMSLSLDYRYPLTGDYRSVYIGRLSLEGFSSGHHGLGVSLGAGGVHLKSGTLADRGAHDPVLFEAALFYRLYFTLPESLFRPYGTVQFGVNSLWFDYREDPDSGFETIQTDVVAGFDAYVGMGLQVNLTESFQIFAEMGYGGVGFLETTSAELKNELFDSFGYVAIKGGLGWRF